MRPVTRRLPAGCFGLALILAAACGRHPAPEFPQAEPAVVTPAPVPAPPAPDPQADLLVESERWFVEGSDLLERGHLEQARRAFDRALDILLESPAGAHASLRLEAQFDRLVDRISALELVALAQGDGFSARTDEPATIDELLATSIEDLAPPAGLHDTVEADLRRTAHDLPIPLNGEVLGYVDLFQGRLKPFLTDGLTRGSRYLPMIQEIFREAGLPLDLAYIPLIESAFKPNALSRAKARGVWQFMRQTAKENGLREDWYVDERSDPEKATRAAARYLSTLYGIFDGDWELALASYNGGPGRVQRAVKRTGQRDFWGLAAHDALPRETRRYVPMVLAAIIIARNPEQYGFAIEPEPPEAYETVGLPGPFDLRRLAEWAGVSIDDLRTLNPELRRWITPVTESAYAVKVPPGTAARLAARVATATPAERAYFNFHTVRKGETLSGIAARLGLRWQDLAAANQLSAKSTLQIGQELMVPVEPAEVLVRGVGQTTAAAAPTTGGGSALVYHVKRGDTLYDIARLFDTTVAALKSWNRLPSNRIMPGDRLTIRRSTGGR